jgi:pre-mRNA-processing factor 19
VAGSASDAGVVSLSQNKLLQTLSGGQGSVTSGVWAQDNVVIATSTGLVKVFEAEREVSSFSDHAGSVNGVALHPSGTIVASVGDDKTYILYDLETFNKLTQVQTSSGTLCFVHYGMTLLTNSTQLSPLSNSILMVTCSPLAVGMGISRSSM